jgi:hypothetical protein
VPITQSRARYPETRSKEDQAPRALLEQVSLLQISINFRQFWSIFVNFDQFSSLLITFRQVWSLFVNFDQLSSILTNMFVEKWSTFTQIGQNFEQLNTFGEHPTSRINFWSWPQLL